MRIVHAWALALLFCGCEGGSPSAPHPGVSAAGAAGADVAVDPSVGRARDAAADPRVTAITQRAHRDAKDRALDAGRKPAELFAFGGVRPGSKVAEIGAWEGYGAELLARAVAPDGKVYAVDPPEFDKYTRKVWDNCAKRPAFARIVRVARPYDDPLPEGTPPLDVAFVTLFYHDMVWLKVDRDAMNAALFRALKPGGALVIVDHSAKPGEGTAASPSRSTASRSTS